MYEQLITDIYRSAGIAGVDPGAMANWDEGLRNGTYTPEDIARNVGGRVPSGGMSMLQTGGQPAHFLGAIPGVIGTIGTVAGAIGGAVGVIKGAFGGGTKTMPAPGGYGSPPAIPSLPNETTPRGVVRRMVERVLPGGRTGKELMPYAGTEVDRAGRPIAVHPTTIERRYVPPGYVIVRGPDGQAIGMLKGAARAMGLWKGRPKPPISGYDARAIKRAARAQDRVKRLAGDVGLAYCKRPKGSGKFKSTSRKKRS